MTAKARLLVVDDEATICNFLVRVLEREGYEVAAACDGIEALHLLADQPFDLLLTDIRMDRLNGVELLKEAKARDPDLAVILLTGHATVDSAVTALRRGAFNYLLKPVKNEEIIAAVEAGLQERGRQQRRDRLEQIATRFSDVMSGEETLSVMAKPLTTIQCGALTLNSASYAAQLGDQRLNLTPTEFRLLLTLVQSPGITFDYVKLVQDACGYTCTRQEAQEIIGTHIRNLRQKLGVEPDHALYIESVRSVGYRLIPAIE